MSIGVLLRYALDSDAVVHQGIFWGVVGVGDAMRGARCVKNGFESRVAWIVVLIRKRGCPESRAWVPDALHKSVPLESSAASRESLTLTI